MERSQEVKRATAPGRLRISCPKDPADAEAQMDETPLIEKFKKGNLQAFSVSLAAQIGTARAAWSKRKRHGFSEAQILLERTNVGRNSAERPEMAPSEEEEDEAPLLPSSTPFGRSRSKDGAKEDELIMDMSNIPRRARSSGFRISSLRRQPEPCSAGTSLKQAPTTYQQRSPSPNLLGKRPGGTKSRPLKDFKVMRRAPQISDQEVEVAEVLFGLSRGIPSCLQSSKKGLKEEEFDSSSSQVAGIPASEHLLKSSCPSSEPKSKRQRASSNQEETTVLATSEMTGGGGEHQSQNIQNTAIGDLSQNACLRGICNGDSQLHVVDCKKVNYPDQNDKELAKADIMVKNFKCKPEHMYAQEYLASPGPLTCKTEPSVLLSFKDGEHGMLSIRNHVDQPANGVTSTVDMEDPSMEAIIEDEGQDAMDGDSKRLSLTESFSIYLRNCGEKPNSATADNLSKGHNILGPLAAGVLANDRNQAGLKRKYGLSMEKQINFRHEDVKQVNDKVFNLRKDQEARSGCLPLCTLPLTSNSMVSSTGSPPVSLYGKAAAPWSANTLFVGSSLDRKQAIPAMQHPHGTAQHSAQRMRRCATHVYVAHYIQQRQRFLRQTFWPTACVSGAFYNLSALPANVHGKEQWNGKDGYLSTLQAGRATLAESLGPSHKGAHHYIR